MADYHDKRETIFERYKDFLEHVEIDEKINRHVPLNERLCFTDCMNNGEHLDFTPNEAGQVGQVVRYVHDPDSFAVIASSFEEYLQQLMAGDYEFTTIFEEEF
ncbi:SMI1/KNR4 family protein [Lysinibacillus sp. FSL H8-0500]|uniref:SMI1/KNR4 family protein n=1 Tax=Lysinibacillus sp. FSL H8-0500 TaxID=2921393 RepID=UPI003100CBCD